jgi:hypothetical protein
MIDKETQNRYAVSIKNKKTELLKDQAKTVTKLKLKLIPHVCSHLCRYCNILQVLIELNAKLNIYFGFIRKFY